MDFIIITSLTAVGVSEDYPDGNFSSLITLLTNKKRGCVGTRGVKRFLRILYCPDKMGSNTSIKQNP